MGSGDHLPRASQYHHLSGTCQGPGAVLGTGLQRHVPFRSLWSGAAHFKFFDDCMYRGVSNRSWGCDGGGNMWSGF